MRDRNLARILSAKMVHYTKMSLYWTALEEAEFRLDPLHEDSASATRSMHAAIRYLAVFDLRIPHAMIEDTIQTHQQAREDLRREQSEAQATNSRIVAEREANATDPRIEDPDDRLRAAEAQRKLYEVEAVMAYLDRTASETS